MKTPSLIIFISIYHCPHDSLINTDLYIQAIRMSNLLEFLIYFIDPSVECQTKILFVIFYQLVISLNRGHTDDACFQFYNYSSIFEIINAIT